VLTPNFNAATVRVLSRNGVEVVISPFQGCCGAAAMHTGARPLAFSQARRNLGAFDHGDVDAVVSNAAGCGAGLQEYPMLLAGEGAQDEVSAVTLADKVRDISVYLAELSADGGLEPFMPTSRPIEVADHGACHLAHAQGVKAEARALICSIPGVTLAEVRQGDLCCGSAGTDNLEQPELAGQLGDMKAKNVMATGADYAVSGNVGRHTQLQSHLARLGSPVRVLHTTELLDLAYRGELT
jgi:glycolate oxidase iron-sulfur subunit